MPEVNKGLEKADVFDSVGFDTWGDFGMLDADGRLLENPVHYRDAHTADMVETSAQVMDQKALYEGTGTQILPINTLFSADGTAKAAGGNGGGKAKTIPMRIWNALP